MNSFWQTWRKEIIRGAVLFVGVIAIGLCARYLVARAREGVANHLPIALKDLRSLKRLRGGDFDIDMSAGPRTSGEKWTYTGRLRPKQWLWIRNINGSVHVEPATGDSVQVTAVKSYSRSGPASVRIEAVPYAGGVTICAIWRGSTRCGPGDDFRQGSARGNDVAVDFTVRLPRRVRLGATTANGSVVVAGASAPLVAATVNGSVDAETSAGPVSAVSVNGNVRARMGAFGDTGEVSLITVNGNASLELPPRLDAEVEASTLTGSIQTDYPLEVTGKVGKQLQGTLGSGGRKVHITTVNGSINLKKAI